MTLRGIHLIRAYSKHARIFFSLNFQKCRFLNLLFFFRRDGGMRHFKRAFWQRRFVASKLAFLKTSYLTFCKARAFRKWRRRSRTRGDRTSRGHARPFRIPDRRNALRIAVTTSRDDGRYRAGRRNLMRNFIVVVITSENFFSSFLARVHAHIYMHTHVYITYGLRPKFPLYVRTNVYDCHDGACAYITHIYIHIIMSTVIPRNIM